MPNPKPALERASRLFALKQAAKVLKTMAAPASPSPLLQVLASMHPAKIPSQKERGHG
jgi:hypothetical protein